MFNLILICAECGVRLACARYAVYGIDYEGHGRSEGVRCYIKNFNSLVNDCYDFFKSVSGMNSKHSVIYILVSSFVFICICVCVSVLQEYKGKTRFLYGESMGGAVSLLLHQKDPSFWDGAVLVAPMCKVVSTRL